MRRKRRTGPPRRPPMDPVPSTDKLLAYRDACAAAALRVARLLDANEKLLFRAMNRALRLRKLAAAAARRLDAAVELLRKGQKAARAAAARTPPADPPNGGADA